MDLDPEDYVHQSRLDATFGMCKDNKSKGIVVINCLLSETPSQVSSVCGDDVSVNAHQATGPSKSYLCAEEVSVNELRPECILYTSGYFDGQNQENKNQESGAAEARSEEEETRGAGAEEARIQDQDATCSGFQDKGCDMSNLATSDMPDETHGYTSNPAPIGRMGYWEPRSWKLGYAGSGCRAQVGVDDGNTSGVR